MSVEICSVPDLNGLFSDGGQLIREAKALLLDLDLFMDESDFQAIGSVKAINSGIEIIGYTSKPDHNVVIFAMKAGATRVEPKMTTPEITVQIINRLFDDLDLFNKAHSISDRRSREQLEIHVTIASELLKKRQLEGRQLGYDELCQLLPIQESELDSAQAQLIGQMSNIKPNVLVLEDEDLLRNLIGTGIARQNCVPIMVSSISDALEKINNTPRIDIALLDIGLPDGEGSEVIVPLMSQHPNAAGLMLTAFQDLELIMGCFKKGAVDYLTKPFDVTKFNRTFSRILFQQRARRLFSTENLKFNVSEIPKSLLEELAIARANQGNPVLMKEVCMFYPELKQLGISGEAPALSIPAGKAFHDTFNEALNNLLVKVRYDYKS